MAHGRSVILVGLMGSGKTSVGRALAARRGLEFVDLDEAIVEHAGETIPEIFNHHGETGFRDMESAVLLKLQNRPPMVLATGGGTPVRPRNWDVLQGLGDIVYLELDAETAASRADAGGRPLLSGVDPVERMRHLYAVRAPVYARAPIHIDAAPPVDEVVAAVERALDGHADI